MMNRGEGAFQFIKCFAFCLHVFLVVLHDPPLQLRVLLRHELERREVGVVGIVLDDVVSALG